VEYGSKLKIDWTKTLSPGLPNTPPHYNGAPSQDFLIARSHPETHDTTLDLIRWGLLPSWAKDQKIAWKLINARAETVATASAFKQAFASGAASCRWTPSTSGRRSERRSGLT